MFQIGDWVQAAVEIEDFHSNGVLQFKIPPRSVGHVMEVIDRDVVNVHFERSGFTTLCHADELFRLCDYEGSPRKRLDRQMV